MLVLLRITRKWSCCVVQSSTNIIKPNYCKKINSYFFQRRLHAQKDGKPFLDNSQRLAENIGKIPQPTENKQESFNFGDLESYRHHFDDIPKYNRWKAIWQAYKFVTLGVVSLFAAGCAYSNRHEVRDVMAYGVSHVASRSLEDNTLLSNAEQLSKEVVHSILHDDAMKVLAAKFIKDVLSSSDTKESATILLLSILNDQRVITEITTKLKAILLSILRAEDTRNVVSTQIENILMEERMKDAVERLLDDVTQTPEVQKMLADFFKRVLASKTVTDQGSELGRKITSNVIGDKNVQQQAGEAIWSAVKFSFVPKILQHRDGSKTYAQLPDDDDIGID